MRWPDSRCHCNKTTQAWLIALKKKMPWFRSNEKSLGSLSSKRPCSCLGAPSSLPFKILNQNPNFVPRTHKPIQCKTNFKNQTLDPKKNWHMLFKFKNCKIKTINYWTVRSTSSGKKSKATKSKNSNKTKKLKPCLKKSNYRKVWSKVKVIQSAIIKRHQYLMTKSRRQTKN